MSPPLACLEGIGSILQAAALAFAAYVAWRGLTAWRPQVRGQSQYEAALGLLRTTYALRAALQGVRGWYMDGGEIAAALAEAPDVAGEAKRQRENRGMALAYQNRWKPVSAARDALDVAVIQAEASLGAEARVAVRPLLRLQGTLLASLRQVLRDRAGASRENDDRVFGDPSDEASAFNKEMMSALSSVEAFARPFLQTK